MELIEATCWHDGFLILAICVLYQKTFCGWFQWNFIWSSPNLSPTKRTFKRIPILSSWVWWKTFCADYFQTFTVSLNSGIILIFDFSVVANIAARPDVWVLMVLRQMGKIDQEIGTSYIYLIQALSSVGLAELFKIIRFNRIWTVCIFKSLLFSWKTKEF